jgi:hypothetical protein
MFVIRVWDKTKGSPNTKAGHSNSNFGLRVLGDPFGVPALAGLCAVAG